MGLTGRGQMGRGKASVLRSAAVAVIALAVSQSTAHAQIAAMPQPGPGDPRIREFMYDPDAIVAIRGQLGYEMTIEFEADERIENVSIGDSLSWQVTPNRKATLLFLKPMQKASATSMTVVTNERIYSFLLTAVDSRNPNDPNTMLRLRFLYPEPPEPPPAPSPSPPPAPPPPRPQDFNFDYELKGQKNLHPVRVFDDGHVTYFQFDSRNAAPAVFVIAEDGKEELANTRVSGDYTITDFVSETFILRYGKSQAEVKNRAWNKRPKPAPAPLPQPTRG
jgi:type IV secretion system protein VirB9